MIWLLVIQSSQILTPRHKEYLRVPWTGSGISTFWSLHALLLLPQFSCSVMSNSLRPHGLQHASPGPSPTPGACSNSYPLSQWCHPTISPSVVPFSSYLQSFPASGSFLMSQFFALGGQSIEVSVSASALPMNIQDWFPLRLTGSPCCPRDSQESSPAPQFKSISSSALSFLYGRTLASIHNYWKNHSFD